MSLYPDPSSHPPYQPSADDIPPISSISSFMDDVQQARLARAAKLWQTATTTSVGTMDMTPVANTGPNSASASALVPTHPMDSLAEHLANQWLAQQAIQQRTNIIFDQLLTQLEHCGSDLQQRLSKQFLAAGFHRKRKAMLTPARAQSFPGQFVHTCVDGDRSVGMASVLWHHLSFTTRSLTRPYAIVDPKNRNRQLLCGRIMALEGNFHQLTEDNPLHDVPELLEHEVASLYVPARGACYIALADDETLIPCDGDDGLTMARLFVEHCLLMLCTGDTLHEQAVLDADRLD